MSSNFSSKPLQKGIFREYDIRGLVGEEINEGVAFQIGSAFGHYLKELGFSCAALGRDCRISSQALASACIDGLLTQGVDVVDLGLVPTPLVYFALHSDNRIKAAISLTGSHNPPEYNGFKLSTIKNTLQSDEIRRLYDYAQLTPKKSGALRGKLDRYNPIEAYIERVSHDIRLVSPISIAIDAGNGAGSEVAPILYEALGCDVTPLFCEFDGTFPNHFPDPTVPENLASLTEQMLSGNHVVGLAFDGDADRLGVVSGNGQLVAGDLLLCIFARSLLQSGPGAKLIGDVKCSNILFQEIKRLGGIPIMSKTGHSLIKNKLREEKALLAGEMSGHFFFADRYYGCDDALYAGARLLEILSKQDSSPHELIADLPKTFATPEIRVTCSDKEKFALVKKASDLLSKKFEADTTDGIRISWSDTDWALIRPSNTQPVIVMRFEASSESRLAEIRTIIESALKEARLSSPDRGRGQTSGTHASSPGLTGGSSKKP